MSRKPDGTQRSGRGTAPSAAGGFGGADTALSRLARPFVPKPFRSTGGMSTSADTMMSIGMGRHNNDDEMPEDQVNIASIVDRKVSDRRYLPRKLGNMKYYLNTTPISELLSLNDEDFHKNILLYESILGMTFDSQDDLHNEVENMKSCVSSNTPDFSDLYYGYRDFKDFNDIDQQIKKFNIMLKELGISLNFNEVPKANKKVIKKIIIDSPTDRALIKNISIKLSTEIFKLVNNMLSDFRPISEKDVGFGNEILSSGSSSIDPTGEIFINHLDQFSDHCYTAFDTLDGIDQHLDVDQIKCLLNFIGNLVGISRKINENSHLLEARKKKKKKTDEISGVGSIAGYTGPMAGPGNPKKFYATMARAAGSEYLIDPVKTLKAKP